MSHFLTEESIRRHLTVPCPALTVFETVDSTNAYLKREAQTGAPHGSAAIANAQSAGRGRLGRSFQSPEGKGLYLSVLLRPHLPGEELMRATGMAAVAAHRAIYRTCGAQAGIKWVNDLVLGGKKLAGILAETVILGNEIALVLGIGINVHHSREDFCGEVADIATSLAMEGFTADRAALAAALLEELYALSEALGGDHSAYLEEYRSHCITLGKEVRLIGADTQQQASALDIDDTFGLSVQLADGTQTVVRSGEVSVRGLYGYVD